MSHVVALVGRPNVGKSTLFNQLTRTRDALVADTPGVTRDRKYGIAQVERGRFIVVDTGGLHDDPDDLHRASADQVHEAIAQAAAVVLVLDAQAGLNAADEQIAQDLRRTSKPVIAAVNKIDGLDERTVLADFYALPVDSLEPIAALKGRGVQRLANAVMDTLPEIADDEEQADGIRVAIVGRPNAGKSTLINRLLGEERLVASATPGTTRDSVNVPFAWKGERYTLIDTAGLRRRSKVSGALEKYSVVQTLDAVQRCHVVILMLDGTAGVNEHDIHLIGHVLEAGRGLVVAINKWDAVSDYERGRISTEIERRLAFARHCTVLHLSATNGEGFTQLMRAVNGAYSAATREMATGELTRLLEDAVERHPPPLVRGRTIKLRYAHQGGRNPPIVVIHGNQVDRLPAPYVRYLSNYFTEAMQLHGAPVKLQFRSGDNPYAGKRNKLTPRQVNKRRRMIRHRKAG